MKAKYTLETRAKVHVTVTAENAEEATEKAKKLLGYDDNRATATGLRVVRIVEI